MQDYTPLGSTATTTVKEGILNHEKNINALRSTYSGTAFPTENLVAGLKCYRTDLGKTYTYNGKTWDDSVKTSSLTVSGETSVPTPATENNSKTIANTEFVHGVVSNLVNGAPTALDTLQELASALGNDPNFATTVLNKIGEKESKTDAQIEHKRLQDAIPTKVSQLSNDSGYQKTAEIPVVSQTQNGYMSKDDKAKLDKIAEGATNVTDYVQSVTESNGKVTVTKGGGETTTFNAGLNILVRNKAYSVGDIAYSPDLPSYLYLECTTAGTTGETEPDMSTLSGGIVDDGTAQFSVKTVCAKEYVDALRKSDEAVRVPINNLAGTDEIVGVECIKAGHVVTVHFDVRKVTDSEHVADRQHALLSGFPRPYDGQWIWCIGRSLGNNASNNNHSTQIRGAIVEDFFSWHYSPSYNYLQGDEVDISATYITNE